MPRTYLQWLLSPTGWIIVGLAWPFGVAASIPLIRFVAGSHINDIPRLLFHVMALGGVPFTVAGLYHTQRFRRLKQNRAESALFYGTFLALAAVVAMYVCLYQILARLSGR